MKHLALAVAAAVLVLLPAAADAHPKHDHGKPVVSQRLIDWD